jgi:uncharacterized protein (TIGR03067 family)
MRAATLIALAAGSWAAAAPGSKDKVPPPKPSLVGEWEVVSQTAQGRTNPWDFGRRVFAFTADGGYAEYGLGPKEKARWLTYKANDKADPPTLDIIDPTGTQPWLYGVDGDTLTICLPEDGVTRPAEIEAAKGSKNVILTLKRVAPKK